MQAKGADAVVMAIDVMMMIIMPMLVIMAVPVIMPMLMPMLMGAVINMAGLVSVGFLAQPTRHIDRFCRRIVKAGVKQLPRRQIALHGRQDRRRRIERGEPSLCRGARLGAGQIRL